MGWVVWARITDEVPVQGWTSVMVILLAVGGGTLLSLGIVAEYLGIAARSAMGKPLYLVVSDAGRRPAGTRGRRRLRRSSRNASPTPSRAVGERTARLGRGARRSSGPQRGDSVQRRGALAAERRHQVGRGVRGPERPHREIDSFLERARHVEAPWRLFWCAGAGVVATSAEALAEETAVAAGFAARLAELLADDPALARRGTLFLASSAGGVYAGSPARHPFDEDSPVGAIAPYGQPSSRRRSISPAPRRQAASTSWSAGSRISTGLGRTFRSPGPRRARRQRRAAAASRSRSTSRSTPSATTSS